MHLEWWGRWPRGEEKRGKVRQGLGPCFAPDSTSQAPWIPQQWVVHGWGSWAPVQPCVPETRAQEALCSVIPSWWALALTLPGAT